MATTLIELGHELSILYINIHSSSTSEMEAFWGDRFYFHDYEKPWKKFRWAGVPIPDRISRRVLHWGILTHAVDQWYDEKISERVARLQKLHSFEAVIVEYLFLSKALDALPPSVLKVIDTHDKYTDRVKQFTKEGLYPEWFFTTRTEEAKGLNRANKVIAIQKKEADFFSSIVRPEVSLHTVGNLTPPRKSEMPLEDEPFTIGFVSGSLHLNKISFESFYKNVFAKFIERSPQAKLVVFGKICELLEPAQNLQLYGPYADEDNIYNQAHCFINPATIGTGLKIKTAEPLSHGKRVLTSTIGIEGLEAMINEDCVVSDKEEDWIKTLRKWEVENATFSEENFERYRTYYDASLNELERIFP